MERLKKIRATHRTAFTKILGAVNTALNGDTPDVEASQAKFAVLENRMRELDIIDKQILDGLMEEDTSQEVLDEEMENADDYRAKYENIRVKVTRLCERRRPASVPRIQSTANGQAAETLNNSRKFKLPKIEIKKFNGEPKEWLRFWSSFKKIHDDNDIVLEDKFDFLIQSMVDNSRASEYINSFPPTAENYPKAIEGMKSRFGRDDLLVEVYMRELLKLVLSKSEWTLTSIYDKLEMQIRSLESLGITSDTCAAMLIPLVESALPEEILRAWQRKTNAGANAIQRQKSLMKFLEEEVQNEERIQLAKTGFGAGAPQREGRSLAAGKTERKNKITSKGNSSVATAAGLLAPLAAKQTNASAPAVCIFCQDSHESANCEKAKQMSLESRQMITREKRACFVCLKLNHSAQWCRSRIKCPWCNGKHVLLMCKKVSQNHQSENKTNETDKKTENLTVSCGNASRASDVCLQTLRVKLRGPGGECIVRALIDPGSHKSYVLRSVAQKTNLKVVGRQSMVHLLFGGVKTVLRDHEEYELYLSSLDGRYECCINAFHEDIICQDLPVVSPGPWVQALRDAGILLSDAQGNMPISLLIGADITGRLYTGKIIQLDKGPTALETKLGWTLMGKSGNRASQREDTALTVFSMFTRQAKLSDLWELDILGITDPTTTLSKEAQLLEVKKRFHETVKINEEGRYEVNLPWKDNHPPLSDNRRATEKRLHVLTRKLNEEGLYDDYERVFDNWLEEGIIEKVNYTEQGKSVYFLPHRHVLKLNSTTRIRPVFDASAKSSNGPSLNQCLDTGPNLIELIPNLLLRFRENKIGIAADIAKAFLQISVAPADRSVLNFLWWNKSEPREVIVYRHRRVVFGINSSPFLLGATIEQLLQKTLESEKSAPEIELVKKLQKSFYVDNCVTSVESLTEKESFQRKSVSVMQQAGFDLRGWECTGTDDDGDASSILGIRWDKNKDLLFIGIHFSDEHEEPVTKRKILSAAHKIFDPLGWVCPASLLPKLILRNLWNQNI